MSLVVLIVLLVEFSSCNFLPRYEDEFIGKELVCDIFSEKEWELQQCTGTCSGLFKLSGFYDILTMVQKSYF